MGHSSLLIRFAASILLLTGFTQSLFAQDEQLSQQAYDILKANCFGCHGGTKTAGLDLRTYDSLRAGGQRGAVVLAHSPENSRLFQLVSHERQPTMPPGKKLSPEDIEVLRQWIASGASFVSIEEANGPAKTETVEIKERAITPEERQFWAFQPPRRSPVPRVGEPGWNKNPIDAFLLDAMKRKGVKPSPRVDRRTLIRRAYLDLLGLPPTPEEVTAFLNDKSPNAWEKVVDRLLASPQYGERWARHWLDLVRYADSGGFEFDTDRPDGWRYRDYVVKSFNEDKPYDRFVREQIAGDEYFPRTDEAMIATGFLRLGPEGGGGGEQGRQDTLDDIIGTTTLTFLGMTVSCARCHFHKFDPIPQQDYYRIQAVFFPTRPASHPLVSADVVAAHREAIDRIESVLKPLRQARTSLEAPYLKRIVDAEIAKLPEYMQIAWKTLPEKRTEGQRLNAAQIEKTLQDDTLRNRVTEKD
ncbi:MAG: DUF1549 domain-containing protein, partial [Acidobacteria bacterium]|nr:DUF1549 domain-containing protein [Acidobacteriota bacterium]